MKGIGECLFGLAVLIGPSAARASDPSAGFFDTMDSAMAKMMAGMHEQPASDVDGAFAAMMIPHHQGAIDMAVAELRYGRNPQLKRIAQEIIVDQQQEIAAMDLAIGAPLPADVPAPTQPAREPGSGPR
jgi:uncharacterized protein (DUF305 family)